MMITPKIDTLMMKIFKIRSMIFLKLFIFILIFTIIAYDLPLRCMTVKI